MKLIIFSLLMISLKFTFYNRYDYKQWMLFNPGYKYNLIEECFAYYLDKETYLKKTAELGLK